MQGSREGNGQGTWLQAECLATNARPKRLEAVKRNAVGLRIPVGHSGNTLSYCRPVPGSAGIENTLAIGKAGVPGFSRFSKSGA